MPDKSRDVVPQSQPEQQSGCLSTIARVFWIMIGNFALLVLMVLIVQKRTFSFLDAIFWAVAATILFIRYADIRWLGGIGPDLQPATMKDWGRHARLLLIIAGGVWVIAHVVLLLLRH